MAARPAPDSQAKPSSAPRYAVTVNLAPDGSIANLKFEVMALLLAEGGFTQADVWRIASGKTADSVKYRQTICRHPNFVTRLEQLMAEKAAMEEDPILGSAAWQAAQTYRMAIARMDVKTMFSATELAFKIAQLRMNAKNALSSAESEETDPKEAESKRNIGKPIAESPQSKVNVADIRSKLTNMGRRDLDEVDDLRPE